MSVLFLGEEAPRLFRDIYEDHGEEMTYEDFASHFIIFAFEQEPTSWIRVYVRKDIEAFLPDSAIHAYTNISHVIYPGDDVGGDLCLTGYDFSSVYPTLHMVEIDDRHFSANWDDDLGRVAPVCVDLCEEKGLALPKEYTGNLFYFEHEADAVLFKIAFT